MIHTIEEIELGYFISPPVEGQIFQYFQFYEDALKWAEKHNIAIAK